MKLVLFSDLHLETAFAWMSGSPDGARKRRQALRDTLLKIIDLTVTLEAEVYFRIRKAPWLLFVGS